MSKQKVTDICYIISHGFAARMLLQTDLILKLIQQQFSVAIITPDPEDANLLPLKNLPNIAVYGADMKQTIWDDDYNVKRMYYLEDIKSNPVLWEKHLYGIKYTKSKHPWKRIRPFVYYPISKLIKQFPGIRERFKKKESSYLISERAQELIEKINPKVVVSTYPVNYLEAKCLFAAKESGRETVIHLLSWDNVTSKGIFPVIPDQFIAWGKVMADEMVSYYQVSKEKIHTCGVPHFDQHVNVKDSDGYISIIKELGLSPIKPYIFVAMSSPRFAPHEIDIIEWMAQGVRENIFGAETQLVIRPHPQNVQGVMGDSSWLARLQKIEGDRVAVDYPKLNSSKVRWSMKKSDMDRLSHLLNGCVVCINSGSTVSIDALVIGKPVILTSFDGDKKLNYWKSARRLVDYPHQKKFVEMGGAEVVSDYKGLENTINLYIENPNRRIEKRNHALSMECYKSDGKATERVVATMLQIVKELDTSNG